jgi:histone-lysine N-methyltransferase MLL3
MDTSSSQDVPPELVAKLQSAEFNEVPVVDDVLCNSSTSSTMTECSDLIVASACETLPTMTSSATQKRCPGRPKKDDFEQLSPKKLSTRRTKGRRSFDSLETSSNMSNLEGSAQHSDTKPVFEMSSRLQECKLPANIEMNEVVKAEPSGEFLNVIHETDVGDSSSWSPIPAGSEDSTASDDALHSHSCKMEKKCAFCNCGDKSLLGQGDLKCYEPTLGFNPFKRQLTRTNIKPTFETDDRHGQHYMISRRTRGLFKQQLSDKTSDICQPPPGLNLQPAVDYENQQLFPDVDELKFVGYLEDTDVSQLFEKTGQVWAHHCCAAWSEGVIQAEDYSLLNVDKAVFSGISQKCSYCQSYGATINCRFARCTKKYHYPCATGSGCFQDIKTMSLLCPDHTDEAVAIANQEACCVVCDLPGNILDQLFCTSCGQHYHGNCLDPAVEVNPIVRAGWQCPECKICQTCR